MEFTMHFDPAPDVVAAAQDCEEAVFLTTYGNTAAEWEQEYGPYAANSVFLAVSEPGGDVVACCRFILPGPAGLKSLRDMSRAPWAVDGARAARAAGLDLTSTWDVATVAVRKGVARGGLLSAALYHGLYRATTANDARWIVMIMDARARRLLNLLSLETSALPGTAPGPYLGSAASVPLWAEVAPMVARQRAVDADNYRLVTMGGGLDGIAVPNPAGFVLSGKRVPVLAAASGASL